MQLVGYEPSGRGPALIASDGGDLRRFPLAAGERLSFSLETRRCAGAIDGDEHRACDRETAPYCEHHRSTWVCARCTGTCLKDEMDCHEEHAVYLAAFPPETFKVGVTRSWRLETRLREQGAVLGARLHTVPNGRIAREIEAEIAADYPDRVGAGTKIDGLAAAVDREAWNEALADFDVSERFAFDYGLDLAARPVRETIADGTVLGVRGRILVLETGGTNYAVDMRDLVGYEVTDADAADAAGRSLQSSLGAFD